jgi:RNA polymerase sigma-70 factor (ECF subfamily)
VLAEEEHVAGFNGPWPQTEVEFEAAVECLQHDLVHFACCRLGNRHDAEDAVQEVLVRAFTLRAKNRHVTHFTPFVYRMLINRCTDVLRQRRHVSNAPVPEMTAPEDPFPDEEARRVRALLERIPQKEAEVVRLRLWAELPFETIARIMDTPAPTAKSRYRYALDHLRRLLERGEER